jgi:hypothetical protein
VENVDVSDLVKRHLDYPAKMSRIMRLISLEGSVGEAEGHISERGAEINP